MKKFKLNILFSCLLTISPAALAGIPVIDAGSIAQAVALVKEAQLQLDQLEREAAEVKRRLEGYMQYDRIFDSSEAYLRDSIDDLNISGSEINDYLRSVGIQPAEGSGIKEVYEKQAKRVKQLESARDRLAGQSEKMDELRGKFENAKNPKEREEIANTISLEQLKAENTMKAIEYELAMQDKENEIEERKRFTEYMRGEMKRPTINGDFSDRF